MIRPPGAPGTPETRFCRHLAILQRCGLEIANRVTKCPTLSSGFQEGLRKRLNNRSVRVLFAISQRLSLDAGDQGHIDGPGAEVRRLIADIEHGGRGAIIRRQPHEISAARPTYIYDVVHRRRLGRGRRGCRWGRTAGGGGAAGAVASGSWVCTQATINPDNSIAAVLPFIALLAS